MEDNEKVQSENHEELRAPLSENPEDTPEQSEETEKHISSNVCDVCLTDNLLKSVSIGYCPRCNAPYCIHYASKIDPRYCVDCMSEVSVEKKIISKEYTHYNEETDTVYKYSRRARQIKIEGLDWLFVQRKIKTLTDAELDMDIEYHRALLNAMLVEAEQRRNEKMHRYAGVKVVPPTAAVKSTATVTKTIKTTKTSSTKQTAQLQATMAALAAKGFTPEMVANMLKNMK